MMQVNTHEEEIKILCEVVYFECSTDLIAEYHLELVVAPSNAPKKLHSSPAVYVRQVLSLYRCKTR